MILNVMVCLDDCNDYTIHVCYLEVSMYSLEALCVIGQLAADVVAVGEDAVKVSPGPLDRHPGGDD